MNAQMIAALARHLLTTVGGVFAAKYGVDGESIDAIAGAVATILGFGWSFYDKRAAK
jgi:hypothetical protein